MPRSSLPFPAQPHLDPACDLVYPFDPMSTARTLVAPRGPELSCKGWVQEAALRMLHNNLDPEVAERPQDLVVYGGTGKAARSWDCLDVIIRELCMAVNDGKQLRTAAKEGAPDNAGRAGDTGGSGPRRSRRTQFRADEPIAGESGGEEVRVNSPGDVVAAAKPA